MTIEYYDPRAEQITPPQTYDLRANLSGPITIGLLANGFPDSDTFLEKVEAALAPKLPQAQFKHFNKGNASIVVPDEMLSEIASDCSALICAYGH